MNIRTSTKTTTKHNILPFPSFITNKTTNTNEIKNQAHTQTYWLPRRTADSGTDEKRTKIKM